MDKYQGFQGGGLGMSKLVCFNPIMTARLVPKTPCLNGSVILTRDLI